MVYGAEPTLIAEVWQSNFRFSECGFEKFKLCPIMVRNGVRRTMGLHQYLCYDYIFFVVYANNAFNSENKVAL